MKLTKKEIIEFAVFSLVVAVATFVKYKISNTDKEPPFEMYVFVDRVGVLHTSSECKGIKPSREADAIKIQDLQKIHLQKICSRCITEEQLEELTNRVENPM